MKRLALLIALACSFCASAREPLRIHPIGDSITQGGSTSKGGPELTYRYPLQQALAGLGIAFDFVGGNRKGLDASPWPASFDPDHDGYYGRTTAQVRDLMAPIPSDVAIIDLGTNDDDRNVRGNRSHQVAHLRRRPAVVAVVVRVEGGWPRRCIEALAVAADEVKRDAQPSQRLLQWIAVGKFRAALAGGSALRDRVAYRVDPQRLPGRCAEGACKGNQ